MYHRIHRISQDSRTGVDLFFFFVREVYTRGQYLLIYSSEADYLSSQLGGRGVRHLSTSLNHRSQETWQHPRVGGRGRTRRRGRVPPPLYLPLARKQQHRFYTRPKTISRGPPAGSLIGIFRIFFYSSLCFFFVSRLCLRFQFLKLPPRFFVRRHDYTFVSLIYCCVVRFVLPLSYFLIHLFCFLLSHTRAD